ncbi:MAG: dienelactone hydrolase family protein [Deltaproteobacteria bacterium]|nr:dienelactone hydrolase family protein [Deltaproteobacteria bacterium]
MIKLLSSLLLGVALLMGGTLLAACADDGGASVSDMGSQDGATVDGRRADGVVAHDAPGDGARDGRRDHAVSEGGVPFDFGTPTEATIVLDGPHADLSGKPKLPPPPPGAVILRISVKDSYAHYGPGELRLKGAFSYDPKTHVITPDSGWAGPAVGLYDDGPLGLEGSGSVAGDRKLGTVVYIVPTGSMTLEYGLESPAGWMWPAQNAKITLKPGDGTVDLTSTSIPKRDGVDFIVRVTRSQLAARTFDPGSETLTVRGSGTHWAPLPCNDAGEAGDVMAGDGVFTCRLSAHIGDGKRFPHLGLLQSGATFRFVIDLGGKAYAETAGVTVQLQGASATVSASLSKVSGNLQIVVPGSLKARKAPAPPSLGLPAGLRGDLPGGQYDLAKTSAGIGGHYVIPSWYDVHTKLPVLVALHGAAERGIWMVKVWEQLVRDQGFILVAPSSFGATSWNWVYGKKPTEEQAILAAVAWMKAHYAVKSGQVGVEGFSDGASMALRMGLNNPGVFAALMANSAGSTGSTYKALPPIKVFLSHGEADAILPYSNAQSIRNKLLTLNFDVTWVHFPVGSGFEYHVFPTSQKIPMLRWFAKAAP